jgi:adenylate kinase family enzyme
LQNYLIDGFPRTVEQAVQFEQNVLEANQVLYFDAPKELMLERCLKRAETSGRVDDKADVLEKRVQNFLD